MNRHGRHTGWRFLYETGIILPSTQSHRLATLYMQGRARGGFALPVILPSYQGR
jgi:hypothetical protein